jgi:PAS domain S-box-containing protein
VKPKERKPAAVRQRAERLWAQRKAKTPALPRSSDELLRLTHELEVHQIELEMQTESLRRANLELEEAYNELYDFAPVGYFTFDQEGVIRKSNLTAIAMLGPGQTALVGRHFVDYVAPAMHEKFRLFMQALRSNESKQTCLLTLMKAGTVVVPLEVYIEATPWKAEQRKAPQYRVVAVDITSARQAEFDRRQTQERMKLAVEAANTGVWEQELGAEQIFLSPECSKVLGVEQLCVTLATVRKLVHPDDASLAMSMFTAAGPATETRSVEFRIVGDQGRLTWIQGTYRTQGDLNGTPVHVIGTMMDITARKQHEEYLHRASAAEQERPPERIGDASVGTPKPSAG